MFEHYIGIDLHQAFFQACAVTVTGDRAWEDRFPRTDAGIADDALTDLLGDEVSKRGYEIAAHTRSHANLGNLLALAGVQEWAGNREQAKAVLARCLESN